MVQKPLDISSKRKNHIRIYIKSMLTDFDNEDFTQIKEKAKILAKALEKLGA